MHIISPLKIAIGILFCAVVIVQKAECGEEAASITIAGISTNKDTVHGVYGTKRDTSVHSPFTILDTWVWKPSETVMAYNHSNKEIVLDSFSMRPDSSIRPGQLRLHFSVKSPHSNLTESYPYLSHSNGQTNALPRPIRIPPHDSILFGHLAIGEIGWIAGKVGANTARYNYGDSIFTPISFFSGKDSVKFQLRAKIMEGILYHPVSIKKGEVKIKPMAKSKGYFANGRSQNKHTNNGEQARLRIYNNQLSTSK